MVGQKVESKRFLALKLLATNHDRVLILNLRPRN